MKQMMLTAALALALAGSVPAAEPSKETPRTGTEKGARALSEPGPKNESPLVRAARKAQEARSKAGQAQVEINDQNVRNSSGRLTINHTPAPEIVTKAEPAADTFKRMEDDRRRLEEQTTAWHLRIEGLRKEIEQLEGDLGGTEDDYYDEEDESYREGVLYPRFETARKALAEKRKELAALEAAGPPQAPATPAVAPPLTVQPKPQIATDPAKP